MAFETIDALEGALRDADYLPDRGLSTALYLVLPARLIRLQCYEGLDVTNAVYEWNYARQLLHIRAAQEGTVDEAELFRREFLIRRPILEAIEADGPVVLLIDEVDRADEEFEAF